MMQVNQGVRGQNKISLPSLSGSFRQNFMSPRYVDIHGKLIGNIKNGRGFYDATHECFPIRVDRCRHRWN
jgi:hypothetical protein